MIKRYVPFFCAVMMPMVAAFAALPPDANRMQEGFAPTPFSAEEIKEYCKPGHETRYLFEKEGQKSVIQIATFLESTDPTKARFSSRQESTEGELVKDEGIVEVEWSTLQAHASFPAQPTTIVEELLTLEDTEYDCWKYTMVRTMKPTPVTTATVTMTLWFAKDMPGPPIKMIQEMDGKQSFAMTLMRAKTECCEKEENAPETDKPAA